MLRIISSCLNHREWLRTKSFHIEKTIWKEWFLKHFYSERFMCIPAPFHIMQIQGLNSKQQISRNNEKCVSNRALLAQYSDVIYQVSIAKWLKRVLLSIPLSFAIYHTKSRFGSRYRQTPYEFECIFTFITGWNIF